MPQMRWHDETLGLLTAITENLLADLPEVTCAVGGQALPRFLDPDRLDVHLTLTLEGAQDTFRLVANLCQPDGQCREFAASGSRQEPFEPMAQLLEQLSTLLGRRLPPETFEERMRGSLSKSEYARLITGRAAAVHYGLMPASPAPFTGDRRKDPIARAVFLDPDQSLAQWIVGRRELSQGRRAPAVSALETAQRLQPERIAFTAELAAALEGLDWRRAESLYAQLARAHALDHRFTASRANALLALGRTDEAAQAVASLPERYTRVPDVLQLTVSITEARGQTDASFDQLLAAWQSASRDRPEPVRRRIAWLLERGEFAKARELTSELANRGATEESVRLEMALALAAGDHEAAQRSARALGLTDVGARIGARATLEKGGDPTEVIRGAKDRAARLVRGELALQRGRPAGALEEAAALLRFAPHDSEALSLKVRALRRSVERGELEEAEAALYYADPFTAARLGIERPKTPEPLLASAAPEPPVLHSKRTKTATAATSTAAGPTP